MKCSEFIKRLELLVPLSYACDWDNCGLLAGRGDKEVKKVLVALDATDEVIEDAIEKQADILLTHHPLIFKPLKQVNDQDFISRRILKLIQNDINYYAMHTNFDSVPGGMADLAAGLINLTDISVLNPEGETGEGIPYGIGAFGFLEQPVSLRELAKQVKEAFHLPFVTVYGLEQVTEPISRVAITPGSGKQMISFAQALGAQVFITGDMGHHEGIDAVAGGMAVIDGGHYGLEHIFMSHMEWYLKEQIDSSLEVMKAKLQFPGAVL